MESGVIPLTLLKLGIMLPEGCESGHASPTKFGLTTFWVTLNLSGAGAMRSSA